MNSRSYRILKDLMDSDHHSLSSLSRFYQVSERTIRNDIKRINNFIRELDAVRILKTGEIILVMSKEKRRSVLGTLDFYIYKLAQSERIILITYYLIMKDDIVKVEELTKILSVSRSTINSDLEKVKEFLVDTGLSITPYSNRGLIVTGHEYDKRQLTVRLMTLSNNIIYDFIRRIDHDYLIETKSKEKIRQRLVEVLERIYAEMELSLTERECQRLLDYCELIIRRNKASSNKSLESKERFIHPDSKLILRELGLIFEIKDFDYEEIYLSRFLKQMIDNERDKRSSEKIYLSSIIRELIDQVSKDIRYDLSNDFSFYRKLYKILKEFKSTKESSEIVTDQIKIYDKNKKYPGIITEQQLDLINAFLERKPEPFEIIQLSVLIKEAQERRSIKDLVDRYINQKEIDPSKKVLENINALTRDPNSLAKPFEDIRSIIRKYIKDQAQDYKGLSFVLPLEEITLDLALKELVIKLACLKTSIEEDPDNMKKIGKSIHSVLSTDYDYRVIENSLLLIKTVRESPIFKKYSFLIRLKEPLILTEGCSISWVIQLGCNEDSQFNKAVFTLEKLFRDPDYSKRMIESESSKKLLELIQEYEVFTCSTECYGL